MMLQLFEILLLLLQVLMVYMLYVHVYCNHQEAIFKQQRPPIQETCYGSEAELVV